MSPRPDLDGAMARERAPDRPEASARPYPNTLSFRCIEAVVRGLVAYHRHEVRGVENLPREGAAIVVTNHSLATYDSLLLAPHVADHIGRRMIGLVGRELLAAPGLGGIFSQFSALGTRENAERLLGVGELILAMPGGMRESIRDARSRYRIDWAGRKGFAYLSLKTGAPIVLAACPRADDIFYVYPNPITPFVYRRLKLPAPLFRGLGPTPIPRPVKLTHHLSEPIFPPTTASAANTSGRASSPSRRGDADAALGDYHARVVSRMDELMREALASP